MVEIKYGEPSSLQFEMQISGDASGTPDVSFVLKPDERTCVSFKAMDKGNGAWSVDLPALNKYVGPGTYPCSVSVVIGDHYFTPMNDVCNVKEPVKATVSGIQTTASAQPKVTITVPSAATVAPTVAMSSPSAVPESKQAPKPEPKKPTADDAVFDTLLKKSKS